ncbi:ABC transporter substrate-binding protein [Marinicrinis sediminis]|uniref:ABC transporter substrate-binding protein n=1 Tax=Marinicrinis sediminis TaxID=1652465 RepID=A0ABW5RCC9_9BACL
MKHVRKSMMLLVVVVLSLTVVLGGCGGNNNEANQGSESNNKPQKEESKEVREITLWSFEARDPHRTLVTASIDAFNETHEDIQINAEFMDDESFKTKIKVAVAGNNMPDVFTYWSGDQFKTLVDAGVLGDITSQLNADEAFKNTILPGGIETFTYDNKSYAVPLALNAVMLWYNMDMFEQSGLNPPATYDELLQAVDTFNADGITPITVAGKDRWPVLHWYSYLAQREGGMEPFEKAKTGETDFATETFVQAGEKLKELATKKNGFVNGFLGLDYGAAEALFTNEKAAMYMQGDWAIAGFAKDPAFLEKVGFVPFPSIENGVGSSQVYHGGFGFGYAASSETDIDAAYEVIKYLSSAQERGKITEAAGTAGAVTGMELDESKMNSLAYEYLQFIQENAEGFFGYYDQQLDPSRAEAFLNATSAIVGKTDADIVKELKTVQ